MSDAPGLPAGQAYDWFVRGRELLADGHPGAAAELLAHAVAQEPAARSVREAWARALFDSRRYDAAAREFLTLTEQAPDDHYAHFGAGLALWRLQRFSAAAEHLTIAVAMRPGREDYARAQRQVRATIAARAQVGQPADGPLAEAGSGRTRTDEGDLTDATLTRTYDVALLDLDGVVYRGRQALPHAVRCLQQARRQGMALAYVTNNASRPPGEVCAHLRELGIEVGDDDVVTSAQAGARLVRERVPAGARVLAIGGPGVEAALGQEGLTPVRRPADAGPSGEVAAVLMGFGPDVCWRDLAAATRAVLGGAVFVATNTDATIPTADGIAPGNGTLVSAVSSAAGIEPLVAGKPFSPLLSYTLDRVGATTPLVVGDRLDTDIEGAVRLQLPSLLVLTGVSGVVELLAAPPDRRPTYLAADLRGLLARGRWIRSGPQATVDGDGALEIAGAGSADLARVRAAAAACWEAADRDREPTWTPQVVASLESDVRAALEG